MQFFLKNCKNRSKNNIKKQYLCFSHKISDQNLKPLLNN
jgi:predicted AAA+ superfamily ATPase